MKWVLVKPFSPFLCWVFYRYRFARVDITNMLSCSFESSFLFLFLRMLNKYMGHFLLSSRYLLCQTGLRNSGSGFLTWMLSFTLEIVQAERWVVPFRDAIVNLGLIRIDSVTSMIFEWLNITGISSLFINLLHVCVCVLCILGGMGLVI